MDIGSIEYITLLCCRDAIKNEIARLNFIGVDAQDMHNALAQIERAINER